MGIKITSVRDAVEDTGLKILVHGQAGSGKTVFCATSGEPTLIISAEAGLLSIKDAPDYIETVSIESIDDLEEIAAAFAEGAKELDKYKWICLDSVSEIAEKVLANEKEINKDARQAYGNLSDRMFKILRFFRDLPNRNVVMTCKQERHVDDDIGVASYVPSLPGKTLTNGISYLFDEVFAIRVEKDEEGENYHILQCHKDRKYEAKDRSGELDNFEDPSLKRVAAKILGKEVPKAPAKKPKPEPEETEEEAEAEQAEEQAVDKIAEQEIKDEEQIHAPADDPDPDSKIWVCCDCEHEYEQAEEPEQCTKGDCTSTDFYEQ